MTDTIAPDVARRREGADANALACGHAVVAATGERRPFPPDRTGGEHRDEAGRVSPATSACGDGSAPRLRPRDRHGSGGPRR